MAEALAAITSSPRAPYRRWLSRGFQYLVLTALAFLVLGPILTAVLGGLKTTGELFAEPFGLPTIPRWENYTDIITGELFWRQLLNSAIIVTGTVSLTLMTSALLAFVFSRLVFTGRELLFNFFTLGLLFPVTIAFLPVFIQVRQLGLIDSYFGVILPLVAFGIPGSTLILRGFFRAIPSELEDAAYIDGCSTLGFFWYVLLPLARPALGAIVVLQTIVSWNEYFLPLLILTDDSKWPLTLGIMQFQGQYGTDWGRVMAFVSLLLVPAVLFYILTQKYIVTGLTGGELKG
ncbi:MAG: carbohydrate ABC transporter permease [Anaerolineae bacterium]|nr:carbohydrate ABC transporter permease [Anaerolineae bacterium]NUQ05413.1 carbohydrate ABC transporter permease [Anaerolineae bacterium]